MKEKSMYIHTPATGPPGDVFRTCGVPIPPTVCLLSIYMFAIPTTACELKMLYERFEGQMTRT